MSEAITPSLDEQVAAARQQRLDRGLLTLASWARSRAGGKHDPSTTLTMLTRKATELHDAVNRAGWAASNADARALTPGRVQGRA